MRRMGLVGFGSIAENGHLPALQSLAQVEVVAVADISPERREQAHALLPSAALFDSPLRLIEQADVTGIDICTPPRTHAELIVAACRRGLADIVCEKPLVLSEEEYLGVSQARAQSGSRVISVNNWMHSELNRQVLAELDAGSIGSVRSIELCTGRPDNALGTAGWMPHWRTDLAHAGGGIILDHGWHQFYLLMGWMREPMEAVQATTRTVNPRHLPVEDEAVVTMRFSSGTGRVELSWTASNRTNGGIIRGSAGTIAIYDDRIVVRNERGKKETRFKERLTQSSYHADWFVQMFRYNMLDDDRAEADRNFAEAGVLVNAIGAAYRSAQQGGMPCTLAGPPA